MRGIYLTEHNHWKCLKLSHLGTGHLPGLQFSLSYLQKRWLTLNCLKWHWSPLSGQLNALSALHIHPCAARMPQSGHCCCLQEAGMDLPKLLLLLLFCLCKEMSFDKGGAVSQSKRWSWGCEKLWGLNSWSESGRLGLNQDLPHPQEVP